MTDDNLITQALWDVQYSYTRHRFFFNYPKNKVQIQGNKTVKSQEHTGIVQSESQSCNRSTTTDKWLDSLLFFFYSKLSTESSSDILPLSGQLVNKPQPDKNEVCCSGSAVIVVVTSFIITLASVQLCLSQWVEQLKSSEQCSKPKQAESYLLLSGCAGPSHDAAGRHFLVAYLTYPVMEIMKITQVRKTDSMSHWELPQVFVFRLVCRNLCLLSATGSHNATSNSCMLLMFNK